MQEFRKVFKPHACELNAWNASRFEQCLAGRCIIIVGDSTMRQTFQSLACLMSEQIQDGFFMVSHCTFLKSWQLSVLALSKATDLLFPKDSCAHSPC